MSSTFSIALSSLQAQSEAISATGNNLANVNTTGFKGSEVDFKDLVSEYFGAGSRFSVGLGVGVPVNNTLFTQGPTETSTSPLAARIQGDGFFVVQGATGQQLFTRDGNFTVSPTGLLETETGETVQGWQADPSGIVNSNGPTTNIRLPSELLAPEATQNFSFNANLDADPPSGGAGNTWSTTIPIVDSLGNMHDLQVQFSQSASAPSNWSYQVTLPASDLATPSSTPLATGALTFDGNGNLISPTSSASPIAITLPALADGATLGANGSNVINWNLYTGSSATLTQYPLPSSSSSPTQDGVQSSQLSGVSIGDGGQVIATFADGQTRVAAQLAVASIENPNSLQNVGNNNFAATSTTAIPSVGLPQTGGRGDIIGGQLEGSNVDLATQFTNMITYQSAYEAATRVITTADQMNQDLQSLIHP